MKAGIASFTAFFALLVGLLVSWGALDVNWPWEKFGDAMSREVSVSFDDIERPEIIKVEAISLECHARVTASVPVEATEQHKALGVTYRTDTVTMQAIGDVDTCVASDAVSIQSGEGYTNVVLRAEDIEFVRPRVDAIATQDSVNFNKGFVGKMTDALPWVSDNTGLTPAAYSFAQTVIGGSDCMEAAYSATEDVLLDAYRAQAADLGLDPETVRVQILGEPDFAQNEPETEIDGFDFSVANGEAACSLADSVNDGVNQPDPLA